MPIILLEKDPFALAQGDAQQLEADWGSVNQRRPLMSVTPKDPKIATLSVLRDIGSGLRPISLLNTSAPNGYGDSTSNFILGSLAYQRAERAQVVETFGDNYIFFFGEHPITLSISGALINSLEYDWYSEFMYNYEHFLRGTRCVENKTRVFLSWEDKLVSGYITGVSVQQGSDTRAVVPISLSMVLSEAPTDLSGIAAPLENPTSGAVDPWTFVSMGTGLRYAEYLGDVRAQTLKAVDAAAEEDVEAVDLLAASRSLLASEPTGAVAADQYALLEAQAEGSSAVLAKVQALSRGVANAVLVVSDIPDLGI